MSQVVQIFNDEGKPLTWFGEPGKDSNLQSLPAKVVVDYDDVPFFEHYASPTRLFEVQVRAEESPAIGTLLSRLNSMATAPSR